MCSSDLQKREITTHERIVIQKQKRFEELDKIFERIYEDICCKGRKSNPSNTVTAAGSSVAV